MAQQEVQILAHVPEPQPAVYPYQSHPHHPLKLLDWLAANLISPESWDVSNKRFPVLLGPSLIILTSLEWELSCPLCGNLRHGPLKHYVWPRRVEFESLCGGLVMSFQACWVMVMCGGMRTPVQALLTSRPMIALGSSPALPQPTRTETVYLLLLSIPRPK